MKALLIPLAACAALTGCAVYGDPYGYGYPGYSYPGYSYPTAVYPAGTVYQGYPAQTYGTTVYGTYQSYPGYPAYNDPNRRAYRDRDRDGVPNAYDAYPNDPRRR